ncbi:MAG TPA: helix-turn-helix transcriptional regulator, partial [Actinomycetes bacterium]|nr:helix-turn-helix transcriptional regulator [Actinomycetes bacterium]
MSAWFGHGRLRLYLLKLLDDGPKHGYEVIRLMEDRTLGMYAPSAGTIYPRLQRLEQEGLVRLTQGDGGRKVYELTDAGRAELDRREGELIELEQELRDNIIGVADEIRGEVRDSLRELRDQLKQTARQLRDERRPDRTSLQDWWGDWSVLAEPGRAERPGPAAQPGPTTPHGPVAQPNPTTPPGPTPPTGPTTAPGPAESRSDRAATPAGTATAATEEAEGTAWPVGDFERELQRFAEQVRKIAYRTPIDAG